MTVNKKIFLAFIFSLNYLLTFGQLKAYPDTSTKTITIVPETIMVPEIRAEYPGGFYKLRQYINDNVTTKISISKSDAKIFQAPIAEWFIDEKGKVTDVKIYKSSNVQKIDQLLLTAIKNMPTFKPAENSGKKVKDKYSMPLRICFK